MNASSTAARMGQIAVCVILFIVAIALAMAMIARTQRRRRERGQSGPRPLLAATTSRVGSAYSALLLDEPEPNELLNYRLDASSLNRITPPVRRDSDPMFKTSFARLLIVMLACVAIAACHSSPTEPARPCPKVTIDTIPNSGGWTVTVIPPLSKTCELVNKQ